LKMQNLTLPDLRIQPQMTDVDRLYM